MMKSLFKRHRQLKNGAGDLIQVTTRPDQYMHQDWVLDTYRLAYGLSKGDRSVPAGALQMKEPAQFLTVDGSATQDLWSRMVYFGYGDAREHDGLPKTQIFLPHQKMLPMLVKFLAACRVEGTTEAALAPVSRMFAKQQNRLMGLPDDALLRLRFGFDQQKEPIIAPEPKKNPLFSEFLSLNLVGEPRGQSWPVTSLGLTTMPFLIDFLLEKKGFDWESTNER